MSTVRSLQYGSYTNDDAAVDKKRRNLIIYLIEREKVTRLKKVTRSPRAPKSSFLLSRASAKYTYTIPTVAHVQHPFVFTNKSECRR